MLLQYSSKLVRHRFEKTLAADVLAKLKAVESSSSEARKGLRYFKFLDEYEKMKQNVAFSPLKIVMAAMHISRYGPTTHRQNHSISI